MTDIAYLGTGLLGSGFVEAALRRGNHVTVWNRTESKARTLETFGAVVAASPAEAVRGAALVHLVLPDDDVVEDVIAQLRPGLGADAIILDHSTTQPARTGERVTQLNGDGVHYLHCPVFIGPAAARAGEGTILVAGPTELYMRVRDPLAAMATKVEYLGDRPDLAAVYKLCGNAFFIGITGLVADVQAIAAGADVAREKAMDVLQMFDANGVIAARGRAMLAPPTTPSFELAMARKDVRLMIETADEEPLTVLPAVAGRMDTLIAEGHGAEDSTVMGRPTG